MTTEPKAMLALADKLASMRSLHGDWRGYTLHVNERDLAIKALRATAGAVAAMRQDEVTVTILALGNIENTPAEAVHHGLEYARKAGFIESWSYPIASNAAPAGADTAMREALEAIDAFVAFHRDYTTMPADDFFAKHGLKMGHSSERFSKLRQACVETSTRARAALSKSAPEEKA